MRPSCPRPDRVERRRRVLRRPHGGRSWPSPASCSSAPAASSCWPPWAPRSGHSRSGCTPAPYACRSDRRRCHRARRPGRLRGRPAGTGHAPRRHPPAPGRAGRGACSSRPTASRLALVAIIAVTALGLGGSGLAWVDMSGSGAAVGQASFPRMTARESITVHRRPRFPQGASRLRLLVGERGRGGWPRVRGASTMEGHPQHCGGSGADARRGDAEDRGSRGGTRLAGVPCRTPRCCFLPCWSC